MVNAPLTSKILLADVGVLDSINAIMELVDITNRRKRGRPPVDAVPVLVRLPREQVNRIDQWRTRAEGVPPSRPEAIRRLVEIGAHCEPYVAKLLKHLEAAAEAEYNEVHETVAALRRALGEAEGAMGEAQG